MSNQRFIVTAKKGSGYAQVRKEGSSQFKTVTFTSLPNRVQNELKKKW